MDGPDGRQGGPVTLEAPRPERPCVLAIPIDRRAYAPAFPASALRNLVRRGFLPDPAGAAHDAQPLLVHESLPRARRIHSMDALEGLVDTLPEGELVLRCNVRSARALDLRFPLERPPEADDPGFTIELHASPLYVDASGQRGFGRLEGTTCACGAELRHEVPAAKSTVLPSLGRVHTHCRECGTPVDPNRLTTLQLRANGRSRRHRGLAYRTALIVRCASPLVLAEDERVELHPDLERDLTVPPRRGAHHGPIRFETFTLLPAWVRNLAVS